MGEVYKARDRMLDEVVALKCLRTDIETTPELMQRFRQEIQLARKVTHRNVCRIHEYGEDGPLRYICMAFIDGVDLRKIIKEKGAFPAEEAYEIAIQVARGLEAIHEEGIIHRDLKTPNIMRDPKGVVKLMDFGIAKASESEGMAITGTGMMVGTPEYMSPEQAQGQAIDFRSDIYSLGIVVFELFTGRVPFSGNTPVATILKQIQEPPPLDDRLAAGLPRPLIPILRRVLAKDPADRYATVAALAGALEEARGQTAVQPKVDIPTILAPTLPAPARLPAAAPSDEPERAPCPHCAEPVALEAQICPRCHVGLLVDIVVEPPCPEPRLAYDVARAVSTLGAPALSFQDMRTALAKPPAIVVRRATRAFARKAMAVLTGRGGISAREQPSSTLLMADAPKDSASHWPSLAILGVAAIGSLVWFAWPRPAPAPAKRALTTSMAPQGPASPPVARLPDPPTPGGSLRTQGPKHDDVFVPAEMALEAKIKVPRGLRGRHRVVVHLTVDENGRAEQLQVTFSNAQDFEEPCLEALRQSLYKAAMRNGRPVPSAHNFTCWLNRPGFPVASIS
jgi:hypothetical protein